MKIVATALLFFCLVPSVRAEGFGVDNVGAIASASIGNAIIAVIASPDSSGTLDSMKIYLEVTVESRNVKGAVYLWSDTSFVDSTEIIDVGTGEAWVYFDFVNNASITASTEYAIAAWSEYSAQGDCKIPFDISGGSHAGQTSAPYGVWPTPKWTGVDDAGSFPFSIYAYYTVSAAPEAAGQVILIQQ